MNCLLAVGLILQVGGLHEQTSAEKAASQQFGGDCVHDVLLLTMLFGWRLQGRRGLGVSAAGAHSKM